MQRSIVYSNTCLICKDKGTPHVYWGERAASTYERALQHIEEAKKFNPKSHIYQHILLQHPEGIQDIPGTFRFEVVSQHRSSFNRQLCESIEIKNSKAAKMNNKLMYNRCVIPEIGITQPDWKTGEEKESQEVKKKQLALLRARRKEEKIRMVMQSRSADKNIKKKRNKKTKTTYVSFKRTEEWNGRKM